MDLKIKKAIKMKKDFITMLKLIVPALPLIYGLSKIACFISIAILRKVNRVKLI